MPAREKPTFPSPYLLIPLFAIPVLTAIVLIVVVSMCTGISARCAFGAVYSTAYSLRLYWNWHPAYGEIVRYRITRDGDGHKVFHPVYRFTMLDGRKKVGTTSYGWGSRRWRPGRSVVVLYCPTNPRRTELKHFIWVLPGTLLGLAAIFGAFAYWVEPF